jgi:hypothetical protein
MHVQIVNFQLTGIDHAGFQTLCEQLAPAFADVPGMVYKVWLSSPETNTYGGVYAWRDRAAMEAYARGDLFKAVLSHPNFANLTSRDFGVLDGPTAVTHGLPLAAASA